MRSTFRDQVEKTLASRWCRGIWYAFILTFFVAFVLIPTIYVLSYAITGWGAINLYVLSDPLTMGIITRSLLTSFKIAGLVTFIDFLTGLPMAWIIVRHRFKGRRFIDTLIDMPLAVPTSALGFSVAMFWASKEGVAILFGFSNGLIASPFLLVMMVHLAFSYPYMVSSLIAILEEIDITYEIAARTLGAAPLTAARTITLPLFKAGLITGIILSFARSISETGATMIALTTLASVEKTAPVLIASWKSIASQNPELASKLIPAGAFVSMALIVLAGILLVILKLIIIYTKIPTRRVWPKAERFLSRAWPKRLRDIYAYLFLFSAIIIPGFFIFVYAMHGPSLSGSSVSLDWTRFWSSLNASFSIATIVTLINLALGTPMAILIARGNREKEKLKSLTLLLDNLINIPLIIPTVALGFSLGLFWSMISRLYFPQLAQNPFWLIVLAHVAFTYPFIVRSICGAIEELDPTFEDAAKTLGARPLQVFRLVTLPIVKPSILAGAIMVFTRSLDETGATMAVVPEAVTAPVYIVTLVSKLAYYEAALACIVLIVLSYTAMLALRYLTSRIRVT
ncbi:iron ABC transporter permease [Candidatus Bathyarchaeota archaeon]|nr:iron ABC transporter permease [Candidatus Bathyarchaeota archaeon]